ncbi:MBL fold metallo-hydrolase [Psychrobacter pygoscelis]|uniref:MBL fold metallo-hydrolase n=1 Tax=Psychrobacter pygoscelis TaxID=2488563 RepID=UPI00103AD228|nr:MBL fold metallo-hydrolase [Psychrobacter pygoscelis]
MDLIKIVGIEGYIQTTYLAIYPNKLLLLDSGSRADVPKILDYITSTLGRSLNELKVVMVTHMHPDHAGGAKLLKQKTGCLIVSAMKSRPWYFGQEGRRMHMIDIGLSHFVASRQGKAFEALWYDPILHPDIAVHEGDKVPGFDGWEVLETPGHTDHDLSLWHRPSHCVYTADLILCIKQRYVSPYLVTLPQEYRRSVEKIRGLAPKEVLFAHGGRSQLSEDIYVDLIKKTPKQPRTMLQTLQYTFMRQ